MATATEQTIDQRIEQLSREVESLRAKIQTETRKLNAAQSERQRIVEGIARGTVKESEAPRNKAEIEQIDIRIEGLNSVMRPLDSQLTQLHKERADQHEQAAREAREAAYAELRQKAAAAKQRAFEKLESFITVELVAFDELRDKLATEFPDMGGEIEARRLTGGFSHPNGGLVLTSDLLQAGWKERGDLQFRIFNLRPPKIHGTKG